MTDCSLARSPFIVAGRDARRLRPGRPLSMGNDRLRIAESVQKEWDTLSADERASAREALMLIDDDPIAGAPLYEPLRGLWSYRAGHLRIVYRIVPEARFVVILTVHRAEAE